MRLQIRVHRLENYSALLGVVNSYRHDNADRDRHQVAQLEYDEEVKLGKVAFSDTVVDPGAVMVESVDAAQAVVTVATSRRANQFAVWAEASRTHSVKQGDEVHLFIALQVARITAGDYRAEEEGQAEEHLSSRDDPFCFPLRPNYPKHCRLQADKGQSHENVVGPER